MPRYVAWRILRSGSETPLREVDAAADAAGLDPRDRGLVRRLVGTVVRRRGTLLAMLRRFADGQPKPDVVAQLSLGLVQLFFLDRIPDHAAVSETVGETRDTLGPGRARYVNGVLRTALRLRREGASGDPRRDLVASRWHMSVPVFRDPEEHRYLWAEDALSMPAALMKRWAKRFGWERACALAVTALVEPPLSIWVARGERDALREELTREGLELLDGTHPRMLVGRSDQVEPLVHSPAFNEGRASVLGEAALRAASLVEAQPGERILDVCAAPGGKAGVLALAGAHVTACDISPERLERMRGTIERLGCAERVDLRVEDGTEPAEDGVQYDAALIDAPCSNTGVLAARPGARWRFGPSSLASLGDLQQRLLERTAERVRPGGRLVWSTCSLEPAENSRRVEAWLGEHPEWALEEVVETLPGEAAGPVDGGFAARLRRTRA